MIVWVLIVVLHIKGITFVKEIGYDSHQECLIVQQQALEKLSNVSGIKGTVECRVIQKI